MPTIEKTSKPNDANGNMVLRGDQTISWDADNMPAAITGFDDLTTFVYDGDGGRVIKTENGETTVYVNLYFELNLTTGNATAYYYLGSRLVALRAGANLRFVHQDHLTGTSLTTDSSGDLVARVKYYPYGETRSSSGALDTDRMFTGQRLDGTGLYFYNARYYDPAIGRFISADSVVHTLSAPHSLNRYTYCANNPTKCVDPSGLDYIIVGGSGDNTRDDWQAVIDALPLRPDEKVVFLEECEDCFEPYNCFGKGTLWDSNSRRQQLVNKLATGDYTDIKIIGFSEGAAGVANFADMVSRGETTFGDVTLDAATMAEIETFILLEVPIGWLTAGAIGGDYNDNPLKGLPGRLKAYDMTIWDIYCQSSPVHKICIQDGWKGNTFKYGDQVWWGDKYANYTKYHESVLSDPRALVAIHWALTNPTLYYSADAIPRGQYGVVAQSVEHAADILSGKAAIPDPVPSYWGV